MLRWLRWLVNTEHWVAALPVPIPTID